MSNEITTINNNFPSQVELQSVALIARTAHSSGLYGGIGGESKIMMILLTAKELGVGPCQALNGGIWSIQGKVEISARLMNGLIRRAGHSIKVVRSDDECCTLNGTRTDGDSFEVSFTKQDAEKAGLWGSNTWKKYPSDMLYNRCMSRLGRRLFPDVIGQCYVEGEIKEAKEVERMEQVNLQEKDLQQAECVDITHNPETVKTFTMNKPSIPCLKDQDKTISANVDHFQPAPNAEAKQNEKISFEELTEIMKGLAQTDDQFRENFDKYMRNNWKVTEYENLLSSHYHPTMTAITRNIELNSTGVI